jgi:hypothetical protein
MSASGPYFARYNADLNSVQVFDAESVLQDNGDAVCLGDMLSEMLDEMERRGFDPGTASFAIDRKRG